MWMCTLPVRIMKLLGVKMMIVSNAVGGLNPSYKVGDLMLVKDHINFLGLAGDSPLRGPNDTGFGPRFFSINNLYDQKWRRMALEVAKEVRIVLGNHDLTYHPRLVSRTRCTRVCSPCPGAPTTRAWPS